ncbi:MAG: hypothetical protein KAT35_05025 [Candidatus Aenigmarchaeota archaeon]|nr:hypothetical protein [Candidatus Aenigmarchaeota archaeon]
MKPFAIMLFILLLLPLSSGAFQLVYHKFDMTLREDGGANVLEEYQLYMDSNESSIFYDTIMSLNDVSAWKNVTSLENLRIHMDTTVAKIDNVRIRAQRRQSYSPWTGTSYGIVRIEYDVSNILPGSFISVTQSKPRTYTYTLNPCALSFETSKEGDVTLPEDTTLTLNIPQDSAITRLNPFPEYFTKTSLPMPGISQFTWTGPSVLAGFELEFTREEPLETEMIEFFRDFQQSVVQLMRSQEGYALLLMVLVLLSSTILLKRHMGSQKQT